MDRGCGDAAGDFVLVLKVAFFSLTAALMTGVVASRGVLIFFLFRFYGSSGGGDFLSPGFYPTRPLQPPCSTPHTNGNTPKSNQNTHEVS